MSTYLLLALGGAAGTVARFAVGEWFKSLKWSDAFPWHTFAINVAGSFVLGVLAATCKDRPYVYLLLGTGFCGGFTTFSTFGVEVVKLLGEDRPAAATGYAVGSVVAGVFGAWVGMKVKS
jgi:CrcB protein